MKKKPSLLCTNRGLKSASLKAIAAGLSTHFQRKVWRTTKVSKIRQQFKYGQSVDKLTQYQWFFDNEIPALEYTDAVHVANGWLDEGHVVFGRKYLNASCGKGIVVYEPDGEEKLEIHPVYTKYKKKKREFRVHVFKDQVVAVTEKKRRKEFNGVRDTKIRNLANGYVFVQTVVEEPEGLRELALRAAQVSASDFRGVDIGYNQLKDELFVIEVNSAPGIQGTNLNKYLEAIIQHV
ncbi:ATP-grasp fold, RimK-type [uncultured Caudovirales phage]|uniref:ATP-grasp fold, RimK-type n=1 Tax=uncultured Caudovirales phage TaxID=2100421 RepID=A0A6J7WWD7_9CAUD|nr:ATP-grasp fold, RimK-type [uncultured Caudovirales phage]CAB5222087.1 ATP-grasp fold, RimK-type [uncultured Caudovirales phage]